MVKNSVEKKCGNSIGSAQKRPGKRLSCVGLREEKLKDSIHALSLCFCIALKQTKEGANLLLGK
jgi:hypothetical protein